jgi:hypothetical protein
LQPQNCGERNELVGVARRAPHFERAAVGRESGETA